MLFQRILTVIIAAPFLVAAVLCPVAAVFKGVTALALLIGLSEFYTLLGLSKAERLFALFLGLMHTLYLLFCPLRGGEHLFETTLLLFVIFLFYVFRQHPSLQGVAARVGLILFGIFYVGTLGATVGLLKDLPFGTFWIFLLLAMTWLNDTAAYFIGHRFGRRRLAPLISPGKTVEGFAGGFLGSFAGFLVFWSLMENPLTLAQGLILVFLVGLAGPLGDLSESLLKRSFGVKDSGNIIPGHGGMLDRIDALLFAAPVVYFFRSLI